VTRCHRVCEGEVYIGKEADREKGASLGYNHLRNRGLDIRDHDRCRSGSKKGRLRLRQWQLRRSAFLILRAHIHNLDPVGHRNAISNGYGQGRIVKKRDRKRDWIDVAKMRVAEEVEFLQLWQFHSRSTKEHSNLVASRK
jgi:hypothetical protein